MQSQFMVNYGGQHDNKSKLHDGRDVDAPHMRGWLAALGKPALKNDRYRKERGGKAAFMTLFCSACKTPLLVYQKDGDGTLQRCYLNRILGPSHLERLQHDPKPKRPNDLPGLACDRCHQLIGSPMTHTDGRLAFRLHRGTFIKKWGIKGTL